MAPAFGAFENRSGEPDDVDGVRHPWHLTGHFGCATHDIIGAFQRRTGRQLRGDDQEAAILLRDEPGGCTLKQEEPAGGNPARSAIAP